MDRGADKLLNAGLTASFVRHPTKLISNCFVCCYNSEKPDAPKNLSVTSKGTKEVTLNWIPSFNGNSPIQFFIIQYSKLEGRERPCALHKPISKVSNLLSNSGASSKIASDSVESLPINGNKSSATIYDLSPATKYFFRMLAENQEGKSRESETVAVTTEEEG